MLGNTRRLTPGENHLLSPFLPLVQLPMKSPVLNVAHSIDCVLGFKLVAKPLKDERLNT